MDCGFAPFPLLTVILANGQCSCKKDSEFQKMEVVVQRQEVKQPIALFVSIALTL
jgi:hypothetical protein